jgi:hypothetical protein
LSEGSAVMIDILNAISWFVVLNWERCGAIIINYKKTVLPIGYR